MEHSDGGAFAIREHVDVLRLLSPSTVVRQKNNRIIVLVSSHVTVLDEIKRYRFRGFFLPSRPGSILKPNTCLQSTEV